MFVNGNLTKWLLGALLSVVLFVGGLVASVIEGRITDAEIRIRTVEERAARNEERYGNVTIQLDRIETKLDTLDDKMDRHLIGP